MSIDRHTQARRIASARVLRGMSRPELAELFVAEGFGKEDINRLERGDPKLPFTRPRWETLARLLDVPETWFTASDSDLFAAQRSTTQVALEENAGKLDMLLALMTGDMPSDVITQAFEDLADKRAEDESTGSDTGSSSGG